jgi:hypothetical protein
MRKAMPLALIGAGTLLLSAVGTSSAQSNSAAQVIPVKFVCGTQRPNANFTAPAEPAVKPGNYATVINIEALSSVTNTSGAPEPTNIVWTVSMPGVTGAPGAPLTGLTQYATGDITCSDIATAVKNVATQGIITGYVNLGSNPVSALAVTAVYTSQGCTFPILGTLVPGLGCTGPVSIDVVPQGSLANFIAPQG